MPDEMKPVICGPGWQQNGRRAPSVLVLLGTVRKALTLVSTPRRNDDTARLRAYPVVVPAMKWRNRSAQGFSPGCGPPRNRPESGDRIT